MEFFKEPPEPQEQTGATGCRRFSILDKVRVAHDVMNYISKTHKMGRVDDLLDVLKLIAAALKGPPEITL